MTRLLYVEDSVDVRDALATVLRRDGHEVITATTAAEALDLLRDSIGLPDMILLDIMLPDMTGIELRREHLLKDPKLAGIPVVAFTAYPGFREQALALDMKFYTKPMDIDLLIEVVRAKGLPAPAL